MAWTVGCEACGRRLACAEQGPWCGACRLAAERPAASAALAEVGPVVAAWLYGGPVIEAIGRWKRGQLPHASVWEAARVALPTDLRWLVAVAPHEGRLAARGMHLPDLYGQALARQQASWLRLGSGPRWRPALRRLDDGAVRRVDRGDPPRFHAATAPRQGGAVWLVDDVLTSGATLRAAAAALRQSGWEVTGAVVLSDARPVSLARAVS